MIDMDKTFLGEARQMTRRRAQTASVNQTGNDKGLN